MSQEKYDALKRQQELIFDISFTLGYNHKPDLQITSDVMEFIEGSRGLFDHVKIWAGEFDAAWEATKAFGYENDNYIEEIEVFANAKWAGLVAQCEALATEIISVQVVPVVDNDHVDPQFSGPTKETTGWAIYTRDPHGMAHWFADAADESKAMFIGKAIADQHKVSIERQPWKEA